MSSGGPVDQPRGLLLDLDGTVYENDALVPGADRAIARLRDGGVPIRFVTNTTRVPCYWRSEGTLVLDVGAFVAAFEYATGRQATLVGKPSRPMFEAAARST